MRKVFLHIGLYKTGSTTLQAFLQKNRNTLNDYGYLYPKTGASPPFDCHHNLAWLLRNPKYADSTLGTWQELHEEIESANLDNIIISSENFGINNQEYINILKSELKSYKVKVLIYIRRQDLRLESFYSQRVKRGFYHGNILSFCEKYKASSNYYQFLKPWKQTFGIENLIVRPLEKTQIPNIFHDFLQIAEITNFDNFITVNARNIKPGRKALEIFRIINKIYENQPLKREKYLQQIDKFMMEHYADEKSYRLLSYSDSFEIQKWYKKSNMKLAQEYLDREDGVLFYEQLEPYENSNLNLEDFSQEELLGLIEQIKILK